MTVAYPGLDESGPLPDLVVDLWARSNFWFAGFYLAHHWDDPETTWMTLGGTPGFGLRHPGLWLARDCGWRIWPVWLAFASPVGSMRTAPLGRDHGQRAVAGALRAHLERGAAVYLDIETAMNQTPPSDWNEFVDYLEAWATTVNAAGYRAGAYVSRSNVAGLLREPRLAAFGLGPGAAAAPTPTTFSLFPFSIDGRQTPPANFVRTPWDDANTRAIPLAPADWPLGSAGHKPPWGLDWRVVGCQHDWRNAQTEPRPGQVMTAQQRAALKGFHVRPFVPVCPPAVGPPPAPRFQDIDLDSSRAPDPGHPFAAVVVAVSQDATLPFAARLYAVCRARILFAARLGGWRSHPLQPAGRPDDIWPPDPPPATDPDPERLSRGFDVLDAAAASRRPHHHDVFALGIDGTLVTAWENGTDFYLPHRWEINWRSPAGRVAGRRGGPIAAAGANGRLDVLYASADHRLVHQWWHDTAVDWTRNGTYVEPAAGCALVAPASAIAAAQERTARPDGTYRLHVVFVSSSFSRYPEPPAWGGSRRRNETAAQFAARTAAHQSALTTWQADLDTWRNSAFPVWHAIGTLTSPPAWQVAQIPALGSVAPSAGLAAAIAADGRIHLVVQPNSRAALRHTVYDGAAWSAPVAVPAPAAIPNGHDPRCAMSFALAVSGPLLLCAAVDVERRLVWSSWDGRAWSAAQETPTTLNPVARVRAVPTALVTAPTAGAVDVVGTGDEGQVVVHRFVPAPAGFAHGSVTILTWPGVVP